VVVNLDIVGVDSEEALDVDSSSEGGVGNINVFVDVALDDAGELVSRDSEGGREVRDGTDFVKSNIT